MIAYDKESMVFTLHTCHTTYQMKADAYCVLLHTYYGPRISGGDLSNLIQYTDRGFSPNPGEAGHCRTYSLDTLPQEYSSCGVGDFRIPSIELELEDGSRIADFRYTGFEIHKGKYTLEGLPAFYGDQAETLILFLEDTASQVGLELYYGVFEQYDLITRAARVVNKGTVPVRLHQASSLCLDFQRSDLDLITFDGRHVMERCPNRAPLRPGVQRVSSVRGTSSHQHNPFVILCDHDANEEYGLCFGALLLYSGNFEAAVERSQFENTRLVMGVNPYHFCYTLEQGEVFTAPEAALICSPCGFTRMSQQFHRAIRQALLRDAHQDRRKPVLVNNWEATHFDFDAEKLVEIAKESAPLGIELFVMDDGWFGSRDSDLGGLGDWSVNQNKLPGGLEALVPRINQLGMQFGLWIEPEMINEDSALYRAHPDWTLGMPGRAHTRGRSQLVLDFSRADVREHIYQALQTVLSSANIVYLKWDMNRSLSEVWSAAIPASRQGEVYHRYVLGLYDLLERFHQDYPGLLIEGCSGGGGRFDAGMLYYTPQIWCSDNTDAIDRLRIQYGTSFCYPVCTMGAHVSAVPNESNERITPLKTRGVVAMSGAFGYEMDLSKTTTEEKELIVQQIHTYKAHWKLIHQGDYYRLTDPFQNQAYTAWEHVSQDRREALVSYVTGSIHAAPPFVTLRLKGLDPQLCYQVNGSEESYRGDVLMLAGYPIPMMLGDYQSLQLYLIAKDETASQ
ncbi:MAG: alpha-galactosidase [Anaerotruncus sp.]|nr:alpha-galactosidase [Anaerotruncus sp.]